MRILSVIEEQNLNGRNPSFNDLVQQPRINLKSFQRSVISELIEKQYIAEVSMAVDNTMYSKLGYKLTEPGRHALEIYTGDVRHFLSTLDKAFESGKNEDLYRSIEDKRDFLWFAYFKGLITKPKIEGIAKRLDLNVERIWWGDSQGQATGEFGVFQ